MLGDQVIVAYHLKVTSDTSISVKINNGFPFCYRNPTRVRITSRPLQWSTLGTMNLPVLVMRKIWMGLPLPMANAPNTPSTLVERAIAILPGAPGIENARGPSAKPLMNTFTTQCPVRSFAIALGPSPATNLDLGMLPHCLRFLHQFTGCLPTPPGPVGLLPPLET